jgi:hypothetical protein
MSQPQEREQSRCFHLGRFRTWCHATEGWLLLMPLFAVAATLSAVCDGAPVLVGVAKVIAIACAVSGATAMVCGAGLGFLSFFGDVRMRCPFCAGYGTLGGENTGMSLSCDRCGLVRLGLLPWKLVKPLLPSAVTAAWREEPSTPLVVDLSSHQLNGVGIGSPLSALSFLGPAQDLLPHESWYHFQSKGLEIEASAGVIRAMHVHLAPNDEEGNVAFPGTFRYRGESLPAGSLAREEAIVARFGRPQQREEDEEEVDLTYKSSTVEWTVQLAGGEPYCLVLAARTFGDAGEQVDDGVARLTLPD